ncbi:MAG: YncE family protein [Bryobacteraceae bacterium]
MTLRLLAALATLCAAVAQTPNPALLVLNKEGSLAIVDPSSGAVVGRVPTGEQPHEVVVSTDGKLAVTSNYGGPDGRTLSVIDIDARKEIHRVDLTPLRRPHGLFAAGGKIYFTAEFNKVVGRYDPATNQVDWVMGTGQAGTHMVQLDHDRLFTANIAGGSISILEQTGQNWNQTVIETGKGPEGFDISPDGRELWAANSGDGTIAIIDVAARKVKETVNVHTKRSNRLKFTPDGSTVLVSDLASGDLVVLDAATRKERKRINLGHDIAGILVTPDSARAYVAATGDNNVAVIDLKTLTVTKRLDTGKGPDGMAWLQR